MLQKEGLDLAAADRQYGRTEDSDVEPAQGPVLSAAARRAPAKARRTTTRRGTRRFVIVTGLSGSGKTHALRALEDLGYFCVDNLPTQLIPTLAELAGRDDAGLDKVALVVDHPRERGSCARFPAVLKGLRSNPRTRPR